LHEHAYGVGGSGVLPTKLTGVVNAKIAVKEKEAVIRLRPAGVDPQIRSYPQIGVNDWTINRWVKAGKVPPPIMLTTKRPC
jgi:hypothetical protein